MSMESIDWKVLERLRRKFLAGTAGQQDYWESESDLANYDATFAQRIGWKWDYVLAELRRRQWAPPPGSVLDWGCGSGIASRAYLDFFGTDAVTRLHYWDRSSLAMRYAAGRAREKFAGLEVQTGVPEQNAVALISHVLTEMQPPEVEALADRMAASATAIIWVEPGTYETSLALIAVRERLRGRMHYVAPCTHQGRCGILEPGNEPHWCHHFASSPPWAFTDPQWGRFAAMTGIDLRSLPVSFMVFDRRPPAELPPGATRFLGRPRLYKPYALLLGSNAEGVHEYHLGKRHHPEGYRQARKDIIDPLQVIETEGDEITALHPLFPAPPPEQE